MDKSQPIVTPQNHTPRLFWEIALIIAFCITVYILSRVFDVLEQIVAFSWEHENWEVDELFTVSFFLSLALLFLLIRRWKNLKAALSEIKRLRGIIPICASCKRIRDDKGYWQDVEKYITEHSEAMFSHGICPECRRKLYPELAE